MAGKIKGITVEIGGDTTKLGAALDNVTKQGRNLSAELGQINRLLKFDPGNADLLAQKQKVLAEAIANTSKKLETLKEAEKQVQAQFEKGEVSAEQVRELQREIVATEQKLNQYENAARQTAKQIEEVGKGSAVAATETKEYQDAVEDAKAAVADFGEKAGEAFDVLAKGAAALGAAAGAVGGYALSLSTDFDKALNTLIAKTGAGTEEIEELDAAMVAAYENNFGDSIEDVAESMATVRNNTKLSGDELQKTTENALMLRDTFEFDVNESTRTAKMLMDSFGISADEAYNYIAIGAQNGLDKNGDLLDTINEYSVHFKQLGIDAPEMFNMLIEGADSGTFSVDKLGDAVKEFGIRAKDGSDASSAAFEALGYDAEYVTQKFNEGGEGARELFFEVISQLTSMEDGVEKTTAGVSLFGTMWEDLGAGGIDALLGLNSQIDMSRNALEEINAVKYDDLGSAIQGLKRELETGVVEPLGEEVKPVIEDAIEYVKANGPQIQEVLSGLVEKVGEFVGFIVNNGSEILSVVAGIGAAFVTWKVGATIAALVASISKMVGMVKTGTAVFEAFNIVMGMNPIVLIISLIAGLVAAFITLWNTSEEFRNFWIGIWDGIKNAVSVMVDAVVNFFTVTIPNAWNGFITFCGTFVDNIANFFTALPGRIASAVSGLVERVSSVFTQMRDKVMSIAQNIYDNLPLGFQLVIQNIQTIITNLISIFQNGFNIIKTVVQTVIDVIKAIFTGDFGAIPGIISGALSKIAGFFSSIFNSVITIVINYVAMIINYFRGLGTAIVNAFKSVGAKVSAWWSSFVTTCKTFASNVVTAVISFFTQLPGRIYNAISGAISRVVAWGASMLTAARTAATNMVNAVVSFLVSLPGKIYNAIVGAIARVRAWGSSLISAARTCIQNMINTVVNLIKTLPGKFVAVGKEIINGIKSGITGALSGLYDSIKSGLSGLVGKAKDALGIKSPSRVFADVVGKQIPAGIAQGIYQNLGVADRAVDDLTASLAREAESINGATIQRKIETTFASANNAAAGNQPLLDKLDGIYNRLGRLQMVLDSGALVGELIDGIDAGLATNQLLRVRGV